MDNEILETVSSNDIDIESLETEYDYETIETDPVIYSVVESIDYTESLDNIYNELHSISITLSLIVLVLFTIFSQKFIKKLTYNFFGGES